MSILNSNNFLYKTVDGVKQFFSPLVNAATVVLKDGTRLEKDGKIHANIADDSKKLDGKDSVYFLHPRNLLDNSDFRNPVNQRGANGTYGSWGGYTIDRWATYATGATINTTSGGLSLSGGIFQTTSAEDMARYNGNTLTFAVKINGIVYVASGLFEQTGVWHRVGRIVNTPYGSITIEVQNDNKLFSVIENSVSNATVQWAALYEGEYTVDNLPPYVPKGYAAELAECMRYYYRSWDGVLHSSDALLTYAISKSHIGSVQFPVPMRISPSITLYNPFTSTSGCIGDWTTDSNVTAASQYCNKHHFLIYSASASFTKGEGYSFAYEASADL